jgi:hypothetical protein
MNFLDPSCERDNSRLSEREKDISNLKGRKEFVFLGRAHQWLFEPVDHANKLDVIDLNIQDDEKTEGHHSAIGRRGVS